jgi:septation ring formation regulator EzrA
MSKENPLRTLVEQLNQEYRLSEGFKTRVGRLIDRLDGLCLPQEQIDTLMAKIRDTYERQALVEACREESRSAFDRIQSAITAYSNALSSIDRRLRQAEAALETLLNSYSQRAREDKAVVLFDKEKAKALAAFASMNSKNSRIN